MVASQPLHSYTTIGFNLSNKDNGFHHLHAELCGSKYTTAVSHRDRISKFLDSINTLVLSDVNTDLLCCESLESLSLEVDIINSARYLVPNTLTRHIHSLYIQSVHLSTHHSTQVRAPPFA